MIIQTKISPENSVLLVMDLENGVIPESMNGNLVAATESCIAVGTLSELDGDTTVVLTDEAFNLDGDMQLVHKAIIETPQLKIDVCTVKLHKLISLGVSSPRCLIELWANDGMEPDKILIRANIEQPTGGKRNPENKINEK